MFDPVMPRKQNSKNDMSTVDIFIHEIAANPLLEIKVIRKIATEIIKVALFHELALNTDRV